MALSRTTTSSAARNATDTAQSTREFPVPPITSIACRTPSNYRSTEDGRKPRPGRPRRTDAPTRPDQPARHLLDRDPTRPTVERRRPRRDLQAALLVRGRRRSLWARVHPQGLTRVVRMDEIRRRGDEGTLRHPLEAPLRQTPPATPGIGGPSPGRLPRRVLGTTGQPSHPLVGPRSTPRLIYTALLAALAHPCLSVRLLLAPAYGIFGFSFVAIVFFCTVYSWVRDTSY